MKPQPDNTQHLVHDVVGTVFQAEGSHPTRPSSQVIPVLPFLIRVQLSVYGFTRLTGGVSLCLIY